MCTDRGGSCKKYGGNLGLVGNILGREQDKKFGKEIKAKSEAAVLACVRLRAQLVYGN